MELDNRTDIFKKVEYYIAIDNNENYIKLINYNKKIGSIIIILIM